MFDTQFQETDAIVAMGKWAFQQIPYGHRCINKSLVAKCPMLLTSVREERYQCAPFSANLQVDAFGPFKHERCPRYPKEEL